MYVYTSVVRCSLGSLPSIPGNIDDPSSVSIMHVKYWGKYLILLLGHHVTWSVVIKYSQGGGLEMIGGFVGFANLPNQVHRKSVKKGFEFTMMAVGERCANLINLTIMTFS